MPLYAYAIIIAGTLLWALPFPLVRSRHAHKGALIPDRRARWGVALQGIGYTLLWQGAFWTRSPALWQTGTSIVLLAVAGVLSWSAAVVLGRQLRVDAALTADHQLVRSGPYRAVRHPIYTSMLGVLLGTGILIAPWYLLLAGLAVFLSGTEIRMRVEDALLESRFGEEFRNYRRAVRGLIPLVR
ncbi:MAG TPA: isoprenylcysteine carboxylmethyltransferase family protein [Bryobacteraceae bacterium]|nr:isoprenylcysteine carboxylmethyltransferase family protein [Bryobacteraceae bacterium]